jgi:Cof subfamily protein (haloacid dehalogenase superfamily)
MAGSLAVHGRYSDEQMRYRMLVVDVDGTLIGRDRHVSPRVRAAMRAALDAGTLVTLATGRWFRSAQPIAAELGLELPIILHNGALVKDSLTGEVLDHCHLPLAMASAAIELIERHGLQPIVYENAFGGELMVSGPPDLDSPATARYLATKAVALRRVPRGQLALVDDPLELVVADTAERADPLLAELGEGPWRTVTSMSTLVPEARFVEILSPTCSKTNAIRHLAERCGVELAEVMAVGDNFNDLDMIEAAGLGVAMGNAPAAVRARADWVAPSVEEDGLALAIERFVLATGPARPGAGAGWSG